MSNLFLFHSHDDNDMRPLAEIEVNNKFSFYYEIPKHLWWSSLRVLLRMLLKDFLSLVEPLFVLNHIFEGSSYFFFHLEYLLSLKISLFLQIFHALSEKALNNECKKHFCLESTFLPFFLFFCNFFVQRFKRVLKNGWKMHKEPFFSDCIEWEGK